MYLSFFSYLFIKFIFSKIISLVNIKSDLLGLYIPPYLQSIISLIGKIIFFFF